MQNNIEGIDLHCLSILNEYKAYGPIFAKMKEIVTEALSKKIEELEIYINALESRIKAYDSLVGKLRIKGYKYNSIYDLTDIVGVRVITFYTDEVDKIAAIAENIFDIDWENSVDKRKTHDLNSFGYMSLHYICRIPKSLYYDEKMPEINEIRFELQMRTALQHVWSNMNHDSGYKGTIDIPQSHLRMLNCMAGMLELVDSQFSQIRAEINDYKRRVRSLVSSGNFAEVPLTAETFNSYLELKPFNALLSKIASINQAEIYHDSLEKFLVPLKMLGFENLADLENLIKEHSEDAYKLALHQITGTELDILTESISVQNLCIVHILKNGGGIAGLIKFFNTLGANAEYNKSWAERTYEQARKINII